jgi:hypothetical protein
VALKFALPAKIISTHSGERVMYTLADNRVMFLDLDVAKKVDDLGVNVRQPFFIRRSVDGNHRDDWNVWLSPETEEARAAVAKPVEAPEPQIEKPETHLERQLRESIELARQGKLL